MKTIDEWIERLSDEVGWVSAWQHKALELIVGDIRSEALEEAAYIADLYVLDEDQESPGSRAARLVSSDIRRLYTPVDDMAPVQELTTIPVTE